MLDPQKVFDESKANITDLQNEVKHYYQCINCYSITGLQEDIGEYSYNRKVTNFDKVKCPWCQGNMKRIKGE